MVDVIKEISAFKPIDMTRIPEKYRPVTEYMKTAFILYNKALHEIQTGHDDAAKNYVKKAVSIFPDFYDAIIVYGILVFAGGDRIGAVRIFNSVKDLDQRAVAIGILDHLVEEAERPEASRGGMDKKQPYERAKADSVMGGAEIPRVRHDTKEAKYSKGRVFEKSSGYYEEQDEKRRDTYKSSYLAGSRYGENRSSAGVTSRTDTGWRTGYTGRDSADGTGNRGRIANAGARSGAASSSTPSDTDSGRAAGKRAVLADINDFRLLNKCLLIIVAILLVFSIVVSTILINKMSSEKSLRDELDRLSTAAPAPASATSADEPSKSQSPETAPGTTQTPSGQTAAPASTPPA